MSADAPRFRPGGRVRVDGRGVRGHCRTPHYVRGREGVVERTCGAFPNPETLAYGKDGLPARHLYRVRFDRRGLWPGAEPGSVDVEIYEHWLEEARP